MTTTKGVRGTDTIASGMRRYDLADTISLLDASKYPLLAILTNAGKDPVTKKGNPLRKKATTDPEFRWFEDEFGTRTLAVDKTTVEVNPNQDGETISITGQANLVQVGDVLHVPDLGWTFEVATTPDKNTITVNKEIGGATSVEDLNDKEIWIIGNTNEEGAEVREIKGTTPTRREGYCQIFRTPFGVTETAKQTQTLIKENDFDYQRRKKAIEHATDIERAFLFSKAKEILGAKPKRYTEGVLNAVTDNVGWGIDTEPEFEEWLEDAFRHGNTEKYLLAAPSVLSMIIGWAKNKVQLIQSDETYGILITRYISHHGTLNIIKHPLLTGAYGKTAVCLDMECLDYRYVTNRDTKLLTNRQNPGADQRIDEYLTECGLQIKEIKRHAKMSMEEDPALSA